MLVSSTTSSDFSTDARLKKEKKKGMDRNTFFFFFKYKCIIANTSAINYGSKLHIIPTTLLNKSHTNTKQKATPGETYQFEIVLRKGHENGQSRKRIR